MAPSSSKTTTNGISHHFFSCRANSRNSFSNRHMYLFIETLSRAGGLIKGKPGRQSHLNPLKREVGTSRCDVPARVRRAELPEVGTSRCDVPARVLRAETRSAGGTREDLRRFDAVYQQIAAMVHRIGILRFNLAV